MLKSIKWAVGYEVTTSAHALLKQKCDDCGWILFITKRNMRVQQSDADRIRANN